MLEIYQELLVDCNNQLEKQKSKLNQLSLFRFILFAVIIGCLYIGYRYSNIGYFISVILILVFIFIAKRHDITISEYQYNQALKQVLEKNVARFNDDWKSFEDNGNDFIVDNISKSKDLDILSNKSLYQYVSNAYTIYGKQNLANRLQRVPPTKEIIIDEQDAVKDLFSQQDFVIKLQCYGIILNNKQTNYKAIEDFITTANKQTKPANLFFTIIKWLLPLISISLFFLIILDYNTRICYAFLSLLAVTQMLLAVIFYFRNNKLLKLIFSFNKSIEAYKEIFDLMEHTTFKSKLLKNHQDYLIKTKAAKGIKELKSIIDGVKVRSNLIGFLICSSMLMWDFHLFDRFNLWSKKYGQNIKIWLEIVGEVEALSSLTTICSTKNNYVFPTITEDNMPSICGTNIKHPLINEGNSVGNNFSVNKQTAIITGSNMSGKTTFLRTIGINLILAYAGAPVHADSFKVSRMMVFTSMRIEDDVSQGISTFYAELLRIKEMIEYQDSLPGLFLIDEIFTGTNSKDRIVGSIETIKRLSNTNATTLVTTHDFELCELENDQAIKALNYHFTEHYVDNKIEFNYQINDGRCKTTNARYLLKMVGIIKD